MKKIVAYPLVRLVAILVPFVALAALMGFFFHSHRGYWATIAFTGAIVAILALLLIGVERATTGRPPAAIGFDGRRFVRDTAAGLVIGAALFSAVALELALGGHYRIVAVHYTWALWAAALFFAVGAILEELLFRAVLFRLIDEAAGLWIALAVSAAFFGAIHAFNPGATWVSSLAIAVEAGVLLGAAYAATKNLWLPIGLHFAWNFCEGPIFGTQVSGGVVSGTFFTAQVAGPNWLTGGAFGPEAGAPAVVTCSIVAVAFLMRVRSARSELTPAPGASAGP